MVKEVEVTRELEKAYLEFRIVGTEPVIKRVQRSDADRWSNIGVQKSAE